MANKNDEKAKSKGPSAFKLILIVVILVLIPTAMEQLSMHEDTVKQVGRVCVGLGALFFLYGLFAKVMRIGVFLILILLVARELANEGIIKVPKLMPKLEEAREKGR